MLFNSLPSNLIDIRLTLLQQPELSEKEMVTKQRWVEIMKASGFTEDDMTIWHKNFEKMEPNEHQLFLQSLGIGKEEIIKIRNL